MSKISNVPQIRFKGFTDDWEQRKLGELCDMFNGDRSAKYPNASDMVPEGVPFINAGDLQGGRVNLETCNKISKSKFDELSGAKLSKGDIVYCLRGSLGKNAYIDNFSEGTIASSLVAIRPKKINGRFLFHILNSDIEYKQRVVRDEGAAQPNLSAKSLSEFVIPIPESKEEQSVSDFLDNVDDYIALHQRKYNQVVNFKKAMIEKMFPKNGSDTPEIRFKGYTEAWEQRKLGTMITVHPSKDLIVEAIENEGTSIVVQQGDSPILGYSNAEGFEGYINVTLFGDHTVSLYKPQLPFVVATDGIKILSSSILHHQYFYTVLEKYKPIPQGYKRHFSILKEQIANITVNKDEQKKIGEIFEIIDNLITLHKRKLQQLKKIKKAMLEKMFV